MRFRWIILAVISDTKSHWPEPTRQGPSRLAWIVLAFVRSSIDLPSTRQLRRKALLLPINHSTVSPPAIEMLPSSSSGRNTNIPTGGVGLSSIAGTGGDLLLQRVRRAVFLIILHPPLLVPPHPSVFLPSLFARPTRTPTKPQAPGGPRRRRAFRPAPAPRTPCSR